MVVQSKDKKDFHFYAIDNGVLKELIEDEEARKKYIHFMASILSQKDN